ncbi:gamma-glutamyltransferase [Variovorax ginsengisoli]|uniref:Glutathione hydrolase proenzyme n=1 Tax=Variovorax ginsengisoli TaxID=363844 RepID=A0ABT8SEX8_9BURK|nr:gamma-glutamyltransferase [Variovorax ginsengisoli]MDN8618165.1 gamma-glutamyltransferase [Variovorax ginsengisoli]MDO1537335.1 gamma-glutamyltransferase [Variovorax ginsengisoli]
MRDLHRPGRSVAMGSRGAAATSHPLSSAIAIEVMRAGGNAVDAALTACSLQSVLEPHNTGLGGDCFALVWRADTQSLHALNGAGYAPQGLSDSGLLAEGIDRIGTEDIHSVTIPGALDAWGRLLRDHGTRSLAEILEPTIDYAEHGIVLAERAAEDWRAETAKLRHDEGACRHLLTPAGEPPRAGDLVRFPALARTLRTIASEGIDAFYRGSLAKAMVSSLQRLGGTHAAADFADFASFYVEPIQTRYRGLDIVQMPPSGQGLTALLMLNILAGFDHSGFEPAGADRFHLQIEACRLAYGARDAYVADPAFAEVPVQELLSERFAARLRERIDPRRAMPAQIVLPGIGQSDTVYLSVVDGEGNVCSLISSLFHAFGSGKVCPQTGVAFQNRGAGFRVQPGHANSVRPRKRPLHTIIPAIAMRDGRPALSFGVMGGPYQATGVVHTLQNVVDFRMNVQEALDAPRGFRFTGAFEAERGISDAVLADLHARGHPVERVQVPWGGGQMIAIDPDRPLVSAGSDPRKDGAALAF